MALIFENYVPLSYRDAFVEKVRQVASNLRVNPNWLMAIIYFESAKTFRPDKFSATRNYVGLIQFGKLAAKAMGTTVTALSQMSAVQQLDYVEKYYKLWYKIHKITVPKSMVDFYLVTLFPSKVNKGHGAVIESKSIPAKTFAKSNKAFTPNAKGVITVAEVNRVLINKLPAEWRREFV